MQWHISIAADIEGPPLADLGQAAGYESQRCPPQLLAFLLEGREKMTLTIPASTYMTSCGQLKRTAEPPFTPLDARTVIAAAFTFQIAVSRLGGALRFERMCNPRFDDPYFRKPSTLS
jgi:hypothetical protein